MTVIKPSPIQRSAIKRNPLLSLGFSLLLVSVLLVTGCSRYENRKELDFRGALPETWDIDDVIRHDTDGDGENEWVILYAYDHTGDKDYAPIRGAIYDIARREPKLPIIYPYHLQAPGWTFLGEGMGKVSIRLEDAVTVAPKEIPGSALEIVVESRGLNDRVNRVSIYRWRDNVSPELRKRTDPHEILHVPGQAPATGEWYECLGMFSGTLEVLREPDRVTTIDLFNDRSQFALVREYSAKAALNGFMDSSYQLAEPDSACIGFAHDITPELAKSPYPEKIVMAYQETFNRDPDFGTNYLTQEAQKSARTANPWRIFGPSTQNVCVKQISYGPADETESEIKSFGAANEEAVTDIQIRENPDLTPQPSQEAKEITAQVKTTATYKLAGKNEPQTVRIEWNLVREPESTGEQQVWRIDSIREIR
jgi:hypothetical protein